jgi:hypothetical protein
MLSSVNGPFFNLSGFALEDCKPVGEDTYAGLVSWSGGSIVPAGKEVAVRFVLLRARLYSFEWV